MTTTIATTATRIPAVIHTYRIGPKYDCRPKFVKMSYCAHAE
jgi:hypothetical protein